MSNNRVIVPGAGKLPNSVMLVGEAPGREEAAKGEPFVGKSGKEQATYLYRNGIEVRSLYRTNVVKEYRDGNPDPTRAQLEEWSPVLAKEVAECKPKVVVAVGRFATQWFLGESCIMEEVHGIPHYAGTFDATREGRAGGAIVVPVYHPALGFYDGDMRAVIAWDYERAVAVVNGEVGAGVVEDLAYEEKYEDASGDALWTVLSPSWNGNDPIGIDTEGYPDKPWSIQVAITPGTSFVLRVEAPEFELGIRAIQEAADRGAPIILHNAMYDIEMCRAMGLDLSKPSINIVDTMYMAYLLRVEPQGLKPLAWRWCGMRMMGSYMDVVRGASDKKQLDYLVEVATRSWPKPEPRVVHSNDGTAKVYRPQGVGKRATKIVSDYGKGIDLGARWRAVDAELRAMAENSLGPFPTPTLDDVPLDVAVRYSARDADATLRLYYALLPELARLDLVRTLNDGMSVLAIFEEMQRSGMPASRSHFEALRDECWSKMCVLGSQISHKFYGDKPFNPKSTRQVRALMRRRQLDATQRTPTGLASTGKKSIQHHRFTDEAMKLVFDWREHEHIKDSFCEPALARIPEGVDIFTVRCNIKPTRVATRRLATTDPNLLAVPIRTEIGRRVRDCYRCEKGEVFGAWDLSQIEMRMMAHESGDELLCSLFHEGRDVHSETASKIFGIPISQLDPMKHRLPAKNAGFGIIYGIAGKGLYDQLSMLGLREDWSVEACDKLIKGWLKVYGGVASYIQQVKRELAKTGVVRDRWGMPRYLPGIWSNDEKIRAEAGRAAVSHKIQGGAQGMIQRSMAHLRPAIWALQQAGERVSWVLQIHDEVVLKFEESLWEGLDDVVREALTQHHGVEDMRVPVDAEGAMNVSWGGLK